MATRTKQDAEDADDGDMIDSIAAAKTIGIPEQTLRIWRHEQREGQPPFVPLPNGRVRYSKSAIKKWMTERTVSY